MRRVLLALAITACSETHAADWPHWRGPTRNGLTTESSGWDGTGWLDEKPAWTAQVGEGASSPIVVGNRVYALGWSERRDALRCLDAATGGEQWKIDYPAPKWGRFHEGDEAFYTGPSSTPEYDPETGRLYTLGADGDLICWDAKAAGKLL